MISSEKLLIGRRTESPGSPVDRSACHFQTFTRVNNPDSPCTDDGWLALGSFHTVGTDTHTHTRPARPLTRMRARTHTHTHTCAKMHKMLPFVQLFLLKYGVIIPFMAKSGCHDN